MASSSYFLDAAAAATLPRRDWKDIAIGGRIKVFKAMARTLVALGKKGDALTKQVKCSIALSTCEDLLNVFVKEGKAYIVVDPFEAWVVDSDTDDEVAKALRPFLSQGADKEGGGDKTPAVEMDLVAERLRIDQLIKSKEELEAAIKKVQDERKAAIKKAQNERKAANLAKINEEKASVDALIAQIDAAELKYKDHSKRMSSPAGSALAGGGKARGGSKRKAAELAQTKTAVALADDDSESASAAASKSASKAAKKAKKGPAPKDANDFLSTMSREVLSVLRKAGIINTANQLIKAKILMAHEYRAIAKLTSTDPSAHPKIFERLLKWQITMPGEYADEDDEDDEEDDKIDKDDEDDDEDDDDDDEDEGDECE